MIYKNLFLTDRMLGALTRYLRFMGYDTKSAVTLISGNSNEDTILLNIAKKENRFLLTRDRELARRGLGKYALYLKSDDVLSQIEQIYKLGLIDSSVRFGMQRCIICNSVLRPASPDEIKNSSYAPVRMKEPDFMWCPSCKKLYWQGTHSANMEIRLKKIFEK